MSELRRKRLQMWLAFGIQCFPFLVDIHVTPVIEISIGDVSGVKLFHWHEHVIWNYECLVRHVKLWGLFAAVRPIFSVLVIIIGVGFVLINDNRTIMNKSHVRMNIVAGVGRLTAVARTIPALVGGVVVVVAHDLVRFEVVLRFDGWCCFT